MNIEINIGRVIFALDNEYSWKAEAMKSNKHF